MTPWIVAYWALQSMGFSRQEYWSGLPFFLVVLPNNASFSVVSDACTFRRTILILVKVAWFVSPPLTLAVPKNSYLGTTHLFQLIPL